jgi:hypothetical protein
VRPDGPNVFRRTATVGIGVAALALLLLSVPAGAVATGYPPLPLADDRGFLGNVSAPTVAPGGSGTIGLAVGNPLSASITSAILTLQVYALNAFPGTGSSNVTVATAPVLTNTSASGLSVELIVGTLASGATYHGTVGFTTSASTPAGAFAIRFALQFVENATTYRLESRGWFSLAQWNAATQLRDGNTTLNLSVLGVSGVLPETTITISGSQFDWVLGGVLVAAFVLVGIGAWFYYRNRPGSSSGIRRADDDTQAPTAFGKRRTRDGD